MTITLDDVPTLVGIAVMGRSVSRPQILTDAKDMLVNLLGVSEQDARDELGLVRGSSVRLEWLRFKFSYVTDAHSGRQIHCAARAYLLYLLGCTLFSDKSGTRVSVEYLQLFEDLGQVSSYGWGAVALAYLYRQLGYASRGGIKQIAGYLPLLEVLLKHHTI